ncbi:DUF7882 family protein [Leucobacter sp. GX24907]
MGYLHYAGTDSFHFEDRLLTHLRTVIFAKFNLLESLVFTWNSEGVQHSLWLHPSIPLYFEFGDDVTPDLNPDWIEHLLALASSPGGLRCEPEPGRSKRLS